MKSILVATDLSERSDRAIERAAQLASQSGASLCVLHVVDADLPSAMADEIAEGAKEQITSLLAKDNIKAEVLVEFGDAWLTISEVLAAMKADLLVLGTHRHRGFAELFRGTTVERITKQSNVPVLMVKDPVMGPYARPLVGVDYSKCSARALQVARDLVPDATLTIVNGYHVPFKGLTERTDAHGQMSKRDTEKYQSEARDALGQFLDGIDHDLGKVDTVVKEGGGAVLIAAVAEKRDADLVCVGSHARSWLAGALLGSTAVDLMASGATDILVTPL
ncbi:universal stress protein [Celeribacter arenosi]|uniref:Universal stress protein n=1 Tax=Celeribacter arenosi TaxID=792649 RepID=A0ABP7KCU7_9RHOB